MSFAPAFEGTRQTLFVCSNDPRFGGALRKTIQFELENTPGYSGSLGLEYVADIAADVLNKRQPLIGGHDAIKALEVVEAIYQSANTGSVVELK